MQREGLWFVVVNDPEHDFDLMQEASIDDWTAADMRKVNGKWFVTFFPKEAPKGVWCELTWETFLRISQKFTEFVREMESYQGKEVD